ncbi:hypothetical protein [Actinoplanes sp. NPDC051494]|uniref:hypothetical protein n=1 Tax=Actinoplanes sp. NPDC051494 TaxID=3363907 RepID=UPI0037B0DD70
MPDQPTSAVTILATGLDDLCGRINQSLPTDGNYISHDAPGMDEAIDALVAFSVECSTALDHPTVRAALAAAREGATS